MSEKSSVTVPVGMLEVPSVSTMTLRRPPRYQHAEMADGERGLGVPRHVSILGCRMAGYPGWSRPAAEMDSPAVGRRCGTCSLPRTARPRSSNLPSSAAGRWWRGCRPRYAPAAPAANGRRSVRVILEVRVRSSPHDHVHGRTRGLRPCHNPWPRSGRSGYVGTRGGQGVRDLPDKGLHADRWADVRATHRVLALGVALGRRSRTVLGYLNFPTEQDALSASAVALLSRRLATVPWPSRRALARRATGSKRHRDGGAPCRGRARPLPTARPCRRRSLGSVRRPTRLASTHRQYRPPWSERVAGDRCAKLLRLRDRVPPKAGRPGRSRPPPVWSTRASPPSRPPTISAAAVPQLAKEPVSGTARISAGHLPPGPFGFQPRPDRRPVEGGERLERLASRLDVAVATSSPARWIVMTAPRRRRSSVPRRSIWRASSSRPHVATPIDRFTRRTLTPLADDRPSTLPASNAGERHRSAPRRLEHTPSRACRCASRRP